MHEIALAFSVGAETASPVVHLRLFLSPCDASARDEPLCCCVALVLFDLCPIELEQLSKYDSFFACLRDFGCVLRRQLEQQVSRQT